MKKKLGKIFVHAQQNLDTQLEIVILFFTPLSLRKNLQIISSWKEADHDKSR